MYVNDEDLNRIQSNSVHLRAIRIWIFIVWCNFEQTIFIVKSMLFLHLRLIWLKNSSSWRKMENTVGGKKMQGWVLINSAVRHWDCRPLSFAGHHRLLRKRGRSARVCRMEAATWRCRRHKKRENHLNEFRQPLPKSREQPSGCSPVHRLSHPRFGFRGPRGLDSGRLTTPFRKWVSSNFSK